MAVLAKPLRCLAILLAPIVLAAPLAVAPASAQSTEAADAHHIYMATWRGCEEACQGFIDYLDLNGVPTRYTIRDAEQDESNLAAMVAEIRDLSPDLVVTWGLTTHAGIAGPHDADDDPAFITDIPVVYMYVSGADRAGIAESADFTGRRNVAGTDYAVPIASQLSAIAAYRPYERLGLIYDPAQPQSINRRDVVADHADEMGFELIDIPLPLDGEGRPYVDGIAEAVTAVKEAGAEFLYFGFSSFLVVNVDEFTRLAVEAGLPVFTGGQKPVYEADALIGLFTNLRNVGQLAAYQAEKILEEGAVPGDLPIARFNRYNLVVNMAVAHALGLYPPLSMIGYAEIVNAEG